MHITRYDNEKYSCQCNTPITDDYETLMDSDWVCPICGEKVLIEINIPDTQNFTVIRKRADEIVSGDLVFYYVDYQIHQVYNAERDNRKKNNTYICLKEFGGVSFPNEEYLECFL
ncbi:hypothetical protein LAD12857_19790 [Lacrimispora amygdalina]|uniref:Rubredoxin-like domain-containing protein n=1 Tax=Lacrimispora amygdalina TaxID=253257 RepID=A0ABQ5M528_9FIRM